MFEHFDDPEPVALRPRVDDVMREAKRRTVRRIGAVSTCAVLMFGTAFAANRYFRTEQSVKIQEAAQRGASTNHSGRPDHPGSSKQPAPGGTNQPKPGSGNPPGAATNPSGGNGSQTNQGGGTPTGNTFTAPGTGNGTGPGSGGTTGGTTPGGGGGGGESGNPPPAPTELEWSATANTTQSPSATNAFVDVTVTITNPTAAAMSLDFKECDPSCKRVDDLGDGRLAPDWNASEGSTITTIAAGHTITYTEHIRTRTGAGFLAPGQYTLVIYGTSVPITITAS